MAFDFPLPEGCGKVSHRVAGDKILGVLKGGDHPLDSWLEWAESASKIYAADGAGLSLIKRGFSPIVVGDLDSFSPPDHQGPPIFHDPDPDRTDAEKMLDKIAADGHGAAHIAGWEGDRMDHVLGGLGAFARSPLEISLIMRRGLGFVLRGPAEKSVPAAAGQRFSFLPITECLGAGIHGAEWAFEGKEMRPDRFRSISNRAKGPITVALTSGAALLILESKGAPKPSW